MAGEAMTIALPAAQSFDLERGDIIATRHGWARVIGRAGECAVLEVLPRWHPAGLWRTVACAVGMGGWT